MGLILSSNHKLLLIFCIIVLALIFQRQAYSVDENWLFERYQSGDIDTIRSLLNSIPEESAAGQFFRGVFETDGEAARFYYDRILALYPNSSSEAWALERLWQYHWSLGDMAQAEKYYDFLLTRHLDHPRLAEKPDFNAASGLEELTEEPRTVKRAELFPETGKWRVQLGAYGRRKGAEDVAGRVMSFGSADLIDKEVNGKNLTVVMIGRFHTREEAEQLSAKIQAMTGIKGIVVIVEN
ncbi:SPOR domain-containing protein [bacterium]|nr:SPOR domain-containing protein [bacterium]